MGLNKRITKHGRTYEYWNISAIFHIPSMNKVQVNLNLWADKNYRFTKGATPAGNVGFEFSNSDKDKPDNPLTVTELNKNGNNPMKILYREIKKLDPEFTDDL